MKYLLLALSSYGCTWYLVGLLIRGRLADLADGLRHRPEAPSPGEYLRAVEQHARRAHHQYTLLAGSVVALALCLVAFWLS
ncbi:hypothetical protein CCOS865_02958 [Pseudomonas reidholzensis]|uniref:Uncharacterized protein n=1 Tax=Pseudomonas reidholzensis TaxID=1785162 RepID=A0A383RW89_9PSED|nr:hypothetical protein [Pseudomonas reidholzensis]SYX90691.1 hypothetical protein CCOS865_02958 [Pseudomonas reidholzensis]